MRLRFRAAPFPLAPLGRASGGGRMARGCSSRRPWEVREKWERGYREIRTLLAEASQVGTDPRAFSTLMPRVEKPLPFGKGLLHEGSLGRGTRRGSLTAFLLRLPGRVHARGNPRRSPFVAMAIRGYLKNRSILRRESLNEPLPACLHGPHRLQQRVRQPPQRRVITAVSRGFRKGAWRFGGHWLERFRARTQLKVRAPQVVGEPVRR